VGAGSVIGPHALLYAGTTVGEEVRVCAGAVLGGAPQHLKFGGGESGVSIGDRTVVREYVTVHRCVEPGQITVVGSDCLLMATSHVAHECVLGDRVIVANGVMMAGHVTVGDGVFLSGNVIVGQFTSIGRLAMISGGSAVRQDIVPFTVADGHPARPKGLNIVGLRRAGISEDRMGELKRAFRMLFGSGNTLQERLEEVAASVEPSREVAEFLSFVRASKHGVARPRARSRDPLRNPG
jgi:UDP-N-acetylglucosamine acyltransferase